jgi:hypothetical protein
MAIRQGFGSMAAFDAEPASRSVAADFSFTETDQLGQVVSTASSAITATVPQGLPVGWKSTLIQNGTGKVTLAGTGITFRNPSAGLRTTARGAKVDLQVIGTNEVLVTSAHLEATA